MPGSFLFTDKNDRNNLDTSSPIHPSTEHTEQVEDETREEQISNWYELIVTGNDSFLTILKRLCIYWRRILSNKIRRIFTLIFMAMLNITARITCFTQQRRPPPSSFTSTVTSSTLRALEEDLNDSSKSLLLRDTQKIDLSSLQNSKMAHMLVRQQTHRTENISIHRSTSSQKEKSLQMAHSVDDGLFLYDNESAEIMSLLKRFASEPQMSLNNSQSTNSNGHSTKNPVLFALPRPASNTCLKLNSNEKEEINFNDFLHLNCDKIQPVCSSLTDDTICDNIDNILSNSSERLIAIDGNDEIKSQHLDEDILLDISPSINGNETSSDRHFRRRKRRSSLTKNSFSLDDTPITIDLLEKLDCNKQQPPSPPPPPPQETNENLDISLPVKPNDDKQDNNIIQTNTSENETMVDDDKLASLSRYRGRKLRHRFYLHAAAVSKESISNTPVAFYLPNETLNVETTRTHSPPSLSPVTTPPPLSAPVSPVSNQTSPNKLTGGLKRINSVGITKKSVHFADSVGRELAQVQYIRSPITDESKEFSFLLGSSLLSSSPPSFTKNHLYVPKTSRLEHKPWSFDVAPTSNKFINGTPLPRRFFCLYRQPISEHPDIYLHDLWKSQIKLERADIPVNFSSTGEQQLTGTLWVTNAGYSKYVSIKYTFNRWLNTCEREAQHRCHSNDYRNIDQFDFTIDIPTDVDRIEFILRYCVNGQEYWDNNDGKNYILQTESAYTPQTTISLPHDCDFNEMRFY